MSRNRREQQQVYARDPGLYGTSRFADEVHLLRRGFGPGGRIKLGYTRPTKAGRGATEIAYNGERSVLFLAPNRLSKGASYLIPNSLLYPGNLIPVDPRGEQTAATARYREAALGHVVGVYDAFDAICSAIGRTPCRINFMDGLDPNSPTFFDEAYDLADAIVIPEAHGSRFWGDEARMLICAIIMAVKADPREAVKRHLGRVRDILNMPWPQLRAYVGGEFADDPATGKPQLARPGMLQSQNEYVRAAAGRILSKPERQMGDVLSTAHQNTHFLESGQVRASLEASDIDLAKELASGKLSLYIVLPPDRLRTHSRLSRMVLTLVIAIVTRLKPAGCPTLLQIDEGAAVGRLDRIFDLYGVLAGSGIQVMMVLQSLTQAQELHGHQWETLVSSAGAIVAFGTADSFTAEYLSKLSGVNTSESLTYEAVEARQSLFTGPDYLSIQDRVASRPLLRPDEFLTMAPTMAWIKPASTYPILGYKAPYFLDSRFRDSRGRPLFDLPPKYRGRTLPRPIDFTSPKIDLGAALAPYLTVG